MKKAGRWALLMAIYALLYTGADQGLWPMILHFHHNDSQLPNLVGMAISSLVLPLALGCLIAAVLRRDLQQSLPWPLVPAPLVLTVFTKYMGDAFYPPYATEFLSLLAASAVQATAACAGWYLGHWISGDGSTAAGAQPLRFS